ncbi:hypothetical protein B7P43_G05064 [Cryptotermes secundus]|uniref:Neurogenic locus notch-like protein 1 n=1 Tax=Cryptotermes secundus TaxID=105785 RepID=A0A2J7Q0T2_9NEOP|nr:hypothetical protein B7P43_G05064 [Cryptotermes secundus]
MFVSCLNIVLLNTFCISCSFAYRTILTLAFIFFLYLAAPTPVPPPAPRDPCQPSPCGPNSQCQVSGDGSPSCTCLTGYIGSPPACRPECIINSECASHLACINQKCQDPCPGSCGASAECHIVMHIPNCICPSGFNGDPFTLCIFAQSPPSTPPPPAEPCRPSPCGSNARCRVENSFALCECIPEYHGNPYEGCRPECLVSSDCSMNRACIRNKCQDPCPGTCGVSAICAVSNHIPICTCPEGTTGDAFRICTQIPKQPEVNPCNPSPCGTNTRCQASGGNAFCECLPGFHGSPSGSGCRPECVISSDCPRDKACANTKCIDPCPGVCGYGARCQVINHSPICSCPPPTVGDPFVECKDQPPPPADPCNPSPCNVNGQCRVVNGAAACTYPECVINQDCPRNKACFAQKCRDPCVDACGINALCQVVNHNPVCSCPEGYVGSPRISCQLQPAQPVPKPECRDNSECTNDKACINEACRNPCVEFPNTCGINALCHVQLHHPLCVCKDGFTGSAQGQCYEIGCRSDSECPPTQACVNRQCEDPCSYTQCGVNAICRADSNHRARCYCPDSYRGDPLILCSRPECTSDDECPYSLACRSDRCENPCSCGGGALCTVTNHQATCQCPPGYVGNPHVSCTIEPPVEPQCVVDADCASKLACFSGTCRNPCVETKPCAANAACTVVDTLPLRTMSCSCLPGFVGDADVECKPAEEPGCKINDDCPQSDTCLNHQCINPCTVSNPCAPNAECQAKNHRAVCQCPSGLTGNPFINCYEVPPQPECTSDLECPGDKSCINERCQDPCLVANPCGSGAECNTIQHRPVCNCPDGWGGNPQVQCYRPECKVDADCVYDKACINGNCLNPCTYGSGSQCGKGADCHVQAHRAQCVCPAGTQGNPLLSCISVVCQYNEDCADDEACDRLNRVCRLVCESDTCADTAVCIGRDHQPKCICPPGTTGNAYIECSGPRIPEPQPECTQDAECPSQLACISSHCQNPCTVANVCSPDQECRVLDTLPLRTVMCQCPPDTIADSSGRCKPIVQKQPQCTLDSDCNDSDKCIHSHCVEACQVDLCGVNALCNSHGHRAVCSCPPGYEGNPHIECNKVHIPPFTPPECYFDTDCAKDRSCVNQICLNPCIVGNPCASGAFCHVQDHTPKCRCPAGYEGNPRIECRPPSAPNVGCTSNSECFLQESCVNGLCVNPCNCGPNAECRVSNHYPVCYCQQGYSGNPQTGCFKVGCQLDSDCSNDKMCYNGECLNPCILGVPCAANAECYGDAHRAACKCPSGYAGNPFDHCERVECRANTDCPADRACLEHRCINPCASIANPPCASNAICYAQNHAAGCRCPEHLPIGNPLAYCERVAPPPEEPECRTDVDCPSRLACIKDECVNPCEELSPCSPTAQCRVLDTVPVRTMTCTCPEGWVPNVDGECRPVIVPMPPGCTSDNDCPSTEACINRVCRNPCDCGSNANCLVQNHRPICSCEAGFEGNPNIACHTVGCRSDSECESGKACVNANCVNPCLVNNPCGANAECYAYGNRAECRCLSGYRGNAYVRCYIVGCRSNNDCPNDRSCINAQCINPCVYDNACAPRAECRVQNHFAVCRCPPGYIGNPYVGCRPEPRPECKEDPDCPTRLACLNEKCQDPCSVLEPCRRPSECLVVGSVPVRTMICVCPSGYVSSGSGTCKATPPVTKVGECVSDIDCPEEKACVRGVCIAPCNCAPNADCRIKDHKPVCTCREGYEGNPEIECVRVGCRSDSDCSGQHSCVNRNCVPVCSPDGSSCGHAAICYGAKHRAVCECPPGLSGNPKVACVFLGCRSDSECPTKQACINSQCINPCDDRNPCITPAECHVYNHRPTCACPPGYVEDTPLTCKTEEKGCREDYDCPSQTACIGGECVNPCDATEPCGTNANCRVLDTVPVRTMICECLPGYHGNAAVHCDKISTCRIDKGFIRNEAGECVCPPGTGLNENEDCIRCPEQNGLKVDERGHCVCALDRGLIIDERGNCICPVEYGYMLNISGYCNKRDEHIECESDDQCLDNQYCNLVTKTCDDPCSIQKCGEHSFCNASNHKAECHCVADYFGNAYIGCNLKLRPRTDFPQPKMEVNCLSDGVQVGIIFIKQQGFNGVLYVKGHSRDEQCRRVITLSKDSPSYTEIFKVNFGKCGLIHVNGQASFVLVIQKHPELVTFEAQAYHIKCVYQTGEQNVTLGFNVSMLTTAGTIANTGPPPTCIMKIITQTGQEINQAEIGDNLQLQVEVQPASIYGGFARSCIAKTMEDSVENEYVVTDENGCATDPTIFGEWDYNPDTQSLLASFNAFKFPSSDNIRFQCNIRVCFGKCQPVNCRGYNAFGRRRREIAEPRNSTDVGVSESVYEGQLREEITIQSNAILTFERREERFVDPTEAPDLQQMEDICVSMIGFIIALVITALLALVAVAVAVSCWLMAYRRKPKTTGPLPHPPEFPNPLFTTPEPVAEPSPDYLS